MFLIEIYKYLFQSSNLLINDHLIKTDCPCDNIAMVISNIINDTLFRCVHASLYEVLSVRPSVGPSVRRSVTRFSNIAEIETLGQ